MRPVNICIGAGAVIDAGVRQRADDGELLAQFGEAWQVFADLQAGCARGDGTKVAADAGGRVGFQIEGFVLGRTAPEIELDDAFAVCFAGRRPSRDKVREAKTPQGKAAGAEEFSPADAVAQSRTGTA